MLFWLQALSRHQKLDIPILDKWSDVRFSRQRQNRYFGLQNQFEISIVDMNRLMF